MPRKVRIRNLDAYSKILGDWLLISTHKSFLLLFFLLLCPLILLLGSCVLLNWVLLLRGLQLLLWLLFLFLSIFLKPLLDFESKNGCYVLFLGENGAHIWVCLTMFPQVPLGGGEGKKCRSRIHPHRLVFSWARRYPCIGGSKSWLWQSYCLHLCLWGWHSAFRIGLGGRFQTCQLGTSPS